MHSPSLSRLLGCFLLSVITLSSAIVIPSRTPAAIQLNEEPQDLILTELTSQHSLPSISIHHHHPSSSPTLPLLPRHGFKKAPGLPPGWRAVFHTTESLLPVLLSAKRLHAFYLNCALAAARIKSDRWQWTIQAGQIALQLTSRDRRQAMVTKELMLATVLMLNEYAKGGFAEFFFATLWHEEDGLRVDVQLRVVARAVEGVKVH